MEENYTKPDLTKEVERLMDEEGFDFGEAVKEAMANGYAAGGITGNKTYHQVRDQFMPMDSESMGYAYGGGVGSMMQPRQNYAIGGDIQSIINAAYPEGNLQSIINSSLNQKDYNINATKDLVENLPGGVLRDMLAPAAAATLSVPYDTIQGIGRAVDKSDIDRSPYGGIVDDMETPRGPSLSELGQAINAENPLSSMIGRTIGAAGPLAERLSGMNFGMSEAAASEMTPSGVRNFRDIAGENLPSGIMSGYTQPSADYPDMIRNPENFPNALQNLERYQDNRFSDLDFQPGYDFIDAPNKTNTLQELYQNRAYNNNPYTGIIDKNIMSRGNPDASLMNKTKNAIGSGIGSIMDVMGKIPTPFNMIKGFANSRNALSKGSQNYNPALQSQVDFLNEQGMYGKNANSGLAQITGGRLAGKNLQSLFGSNDLQTMYDKDLETLENRLEKLDTRFSKLKKSNLPAWQKKQQTILDQIAQNKIEAKAAQDKADNDAKAGAQSFMQKNPNYGNNYNPNRAGGYTGAKDSYGSKAGTRQSNARSSELGFSDIRLKDNIELVGKSPSDINIYNFTYLNDPKVYQGVMAQEVPWASVKHDNGYLMVDYNKVDVDFKAIR
jgi:hypothetical protein